jgi:hypothetical protein
MKKVGQWMPSIEQTLKDRVTLGCNMEAKPTLLVEDDELVPDDSLCMKRAKVMKRKMGPRREASKVVSTFRKLQRKLIKDKDYAADPSPYVADHIFCVLYQ